MTHSVTIRIGWPAQALWQNSSHGTFTTARAIKTAKAEGWASALAAGVKRLPKCSSYSLNFTFTPPKRRGGQHDATNMRPACKAHIDGIADALGVNDRIFRVGQETVLPAAGDGHVLIEVVPAVVMLELRGTIS
jgi:crossover junction endodeoxyribonuclease RusA